MTLIKKQNLRNFLLTVCSVLIISSPAYAGHSAQGPSGGTGGTSFSDWGKNNEKMRRIYVRSGSWLDSVHTQFVSTTGVSRFTPHRGGFGGSRKLISLASNEFVTSVSGYYSNYVRYLRIRTSLGKTYSFGKPSGRYFSYQRPGANYKFAGFLGASGKYLDSVGVFWRTK